MKLRVGFVSNSSSTSYIIWGMNVEFDHLKKRFIKEILANKPDWANEDDGWIEDNWDSVVEKLTDLELHYGECDYECGSDIGRSFDTIGDDETGREFKDGVDKKLREILKDSIEVKSYIIEVCYRDG